MLETIRILDAVMNNLNNVETRGQTNLAYLYNSIEALKNLKHALENPVVPEEKIDDGAPAEENKTE